MRSWLSLYLVLFCTVNCLAQSILHRKTVDEENNVFSYVDDLGKEAIAADTFIATPALHFKDVAAFITTREAVYRFRNGVTREGIYFFDNWYDCENNGTIRYRDTTGHVGILTSNGDIIIEARYNEILPLVNGYTIGLKGAEKTCFESDCEHYYWKGGQSLLINASGNEIALIDSTVSYWDLDLSMIRFNEVQGDVDGLRIVDSNGSLFMPFSNSLLRRRYVQGFDTLKAHIAPSVVVNGKNVQTFSRNQFWNRYGKELKRFYQQGAQLADYYLTASYNLSMNPQWGLWQNNCGELSPEYKVFHIYSPIRSKKIEYLTVIQKGNEFWLLEITLHATP